MNSEIQINSMKDAEKLSNAACSFGEKLMVTCGFTEIEARSLISLLTLIGKKNVKLVAPDHSDPQLFANFVKSLRKNK